MQRPAAFVQCIRCRPLCLALSLSLLLSALHFPSLFPLLLPQAASRWRSLVCCCLSKAKTFDYLPRHLCLLFRLTLNYSSRCSQSTSQLLCCCFYNCLCRRCCPQLPPLLAPLPHLLLLLQFFIFHFIFRSFNFYLCK